MKIKETYKIECKWHNQLQKMAYRLFLSISIIITYIRFSTVKHVNEK